MDMDQEQGEFAYRDRRALHADLRPGADVANARQRERPAVYPARPAPPTQWWAGHRQQPAVPGLWMAQAPLAHTHPDQHRRRVLSRTPCQRAAKPPCLSPGRGPLPGGTNENLDATRMALRRTGLRHDQPL